jgi:hypothetical protein
MSKEKVRDIKSATNAVVVQPMEEAAPQQIDSATPLTAPSIPSPPQEKMQEMDRMQLELAKSKRQTALAQAEKALAQNETAELNYKYVILQLYMKYGLNQNDAISENGDIVRGGAAAYAQKQQQGK